MQATPRHAVPPPGLTHIPPPTHTHPPVIPQVGTMQAVGYVARYVGNVVGATLGTVLYNKAQWGWGLAIGQIYLLNALVATAAVLPFAYHLDDPNHVAVVRPLREQLGDIWHMVQRRTIFRPMAFVAVRVLFGVSFPCDR